MLSEEQVVVDKKVVDKERVEVDVDTVTEDRQVSETVRKEQVEVERRRACGESAVQDRRDLATQEVVDGDRGVAGLLERDRDRGASRGRVRDHRAEREA